MRIRSILLVGVMLLTLAGCGSPTAGKPSPSATPNISHRPSSPVQISIVSPTNGEVVHGTTVHVVVQIVGGEIVPNYSSTIDPTHGHVHLYIDNQSIYMSYTLSQDIPVKPGLTYELHAEWVAADHFPFYPRNVTPNLFFTVAAS